MKKLKKPFYGALRRRSHEDMIEDNKRDFDLLGVDGLLKRVISKFKECISPSYITHTYKLNDTCCINRHDDGEFILTFDSGCNIPLKLIDVIGLLKAKFEWYDETF